MKISKLKFTRIARRHGGMFLGFRVQFPFTVCGENNIEWELITISIGLLFWQINTGIEYNYREEYEMGSKYLYD